MADQIKPSQSSKGATTQEKTKAIIKLLQRDRAIVREHSLKPIEDGKVLLEFNGESLIQKNTLTVIKGKTGVHKSRVAQAICSILIAKDIDKRSALGFRVKCAEPTNIIYVDTERNQKAHFPEAIQSIRDQAGYEKCEDVEQLDFFSFLGLQRQDRLTAIRLVLQAARAESITKGHIVVVLDVVSDCIIDFNDLRESYLLTDEFAQCMKDHDVSFIAVIHENPDAIRSTKARGHLGTEVGNKGSAVFQIAKCGDGSDKFVINVEKSRSSRVPKPVFIYYNDLLQRLMTCEAPVPKQDKTITQLLDYMANMKTYEISKADLEKGTDIKRSTLDRKLNEIIDDRIPVVINGDSFVVALGKSGRTSVVKLEQVSPIPQEEEGE